MKTKAGTLMVNVYYDIPVNNDISAYLMAGAGAAFIRNDVSWDTNVAGRHSVRGIKNVTNLAWSAGRAFRGILMRIFRWIPVIPIPMRVGRKQNCCPQRD